MFSTFSRDLEVLINISEHFKTSSRTLIREQERVGFAVAEKLTVPGRDNNRRFKSIKRRGCPEEEDEDEDGFNKTLKASQ